MSKRQKIERKIGRALKSWVRSLEPADMLANSRTRAMRELLAMTPAAAPNQYQSK